MATPLEKAFQQAIEQLNSLPNNVELPPKTKFRLYGLYSSVVKGPELPVVRMDDLMRSKTEALKRKAWKQALKLTKKQAMEEYCEIVNELRKERNSSAKLSGVLYRKENSGWQRCYVELKDHVIYYYDDSDDKRTPQQALTRSYPSGVLFLMEGFVISSSSDTSDGVESSSQLFKFSIAHPKSHKVFTLASTRKDEAQRWVDCIRNVSTKRVIDSHSSFHTEEETMSGDLAKTFASQHFLPPLRTSQDFGVPVAFSFQTDECVSNFLNLISDKSLWRFSQEKAGVRTFMQACDMLPGMNTEDARSNIAVLGHAPCISAPARGVFDLVWTLGSRRNVDPQLESWSLIEELGLQTRVDHVVYSAVWPTSKRDFCRLLHYRVDEVTGAILVVGMSVDHLMCQPIRDAVRAKLFCTGFLIVPLSDTQCEVKYLIVVDPVIASVPRRFIVTVAATQTSILEKMQSHFSDNEHLVQGSLMKGPLKNLALNSPQVTRRRKKRSTASLISGMAAGGGTQFVKNSTLSIPSETKIQQKLVRVLFEEDHAERWWLKFWLAGITCAVATIGLDTVTLQLVALVLASFAVIVNSNKRAFLTGYVNVPVSTERKYIALMLQSALKDCPSLCGSFTRFGRWRPSKFPRVAVLSEIRGGTATVFLDPTDVAASTEKGNTSSEFLDDGEDFTSLFVTAGLASDHDAWSDRPVLFSCFSDRLLISVDRRCSKDFAKFFSAISATLDSRAVPLPSGPPASSQTRQLNSSVIVSPGDLPSSAHSASLLIRRDSARPHSATKSDSQRSIM